MDLLYKEEVYDILINFDSHGKLEWRRYARSFE